VDKVESAPPYRQAAPPALRSERASAFAGEHDVNRLENDHRVQLERVMPYIIKIVG